MPVKKLTDSSWLEEIDKMATMYVSVLIEVNLHSKNDWNDFQIDWLPSCSISFLESLTYNHKMTDMISSGYIKRINKRRENLLKHQYNTWLI